MNKEQTLTITSFAKNCNISSSYLSMIVNGHRSHIDDKILESLALNLKVSKSELPELLKPSITY
ncbi:helix-turn-helix domain-containing protein [Desulfitobacterium sp.]|uniref:helix-turn-helix domain-containing protein n=1 Tax=Desulfitobacterium sp. TaxID=49981 RepID=UPI0039C875DD